MNSPYINTKLYTSIALHPDQMDNKIYINLKKNLEKKVLKKCFKKYGFITDIYEIMNYKDGYLHAENFMASAVYDITFSCRICKPLLNSQIICQVNRVNNVLITVKNGPILVIITNDRINDKVFFTDNNNNLRYRKDDKSEILKPKEFIKASIISVSFNDGDNIIKSIGILENMATDSEIEHYYKELYNTDEEINAIIEREKEKEKEEEGKGDNNEPENS